MKEITESIVKNTGTDPKYIYVIFEDIKPSDWAGSGKLFAAEPSSYPPSLFMALRTSEKSSRYMSLIR